MDSLSMNARLVFWATTLCLLLGCLFVVGNEDRQFDIEVEYAPKASRPGYIFKLTLMTNGEQPQERRPCQNFFFLLDGSNSTPRTRFFYNKKAIARALDHLSEHDRFNIILFDHHITLFQPDIVENTPENMAQAHTFLENLAPGGYFAARDLIASFDKIIPKNMVRDAINNVILFSNADSYLSNEKQRQIVGNWTMQNQGTVSLYPIASGRGNNMALLNLLSSLNKGRVVFSPQHELLAERLAYLMRTLQNPIGKNLSAKAHVLDPAMTILLQPKLKRLPDLYHNRPFVLYGTTNKLSEFILELNWADGERPFCLKKKISFEHARLQALPLERTWTQLLAQELYERYFEEGDLAYLQTAKKLLIPLNLPAPLID